MIEWFKAFNRKRLMLKWIKLYGYSPIRQNEEIKQLKELLSGKLGTYRRPIFMMLVKGDTVQLGDYYTDAFGGSMHRITEKNIRHLNKQVTEFSLPHFRLVFPTAEPSRNHFRFSEIQGD